MTHPPSHGVQAYHFDNVEIVGHIVGRRGDLRTILVGFNPLTKTLLDSLKDPTE